MMPTWVKFSQPLLSWLRYSAAVPTVLTQYRNAPLRLSTRRYRSHTACSNPLSHFHLRGTQVISQFADTRLPKHLHARRISTLKRRVFKMKKHKKKKRKKKLSRLTAIPWRPPQEDKKITYQMPYKMRRIVKERRRRNKGNRTLRVPRQR